jgi:hypothetical protein
MPADDLVLNVRQLAGYPTIANAPASALLLMQLGIGGPYQSISPQDLVATALATGGDMAIAGSLAVQSISGGSLQFSNAAINLLSAQKACIADLEAAYGSVGGSPIATVGDVAAAVAGIVSSFNGRTGAVTLLSADIVAAGGAPLNSPAFSGAPSAPTAALGTSSGQLATTAFVMSAVADSTTGVVSFNGRSGLVVLTAADVSALGFAALASPAFTGVPTAPTASPGANTAQLATCAFVQAAVAASTTGVAAFNGRTGDVVLIANDVSGAGGALLASPAFTGVPTAPTATPGASTVQLATCAFVAAAVAATGGPFLPLAGGTLTGTLTGTIGQFETVFAGYPAVTDLLLNGGPATCNLQWQTGYSIALTKSSGLLSFFASNAGIATLDATGSLILFSTGNLTIAGNGFKPGGGAWAGTSDARIKTVESAYAGGLAEVAQLNPVVYRYKGNDTTTADGTSLHAAVVDKPFVGLIAQEVELIFPDMVTKGEGWIDGVKVADMRTLDTTPLIFALVNAVNTLAARLTALEARLT